ncbi:preQ(1) synthase [Desulfatitalea alkaliphila]|uniref:NADPH-dependent 7-cyano-7-deazaguanine reductase n=1 Tax=Desulfatitalea alkaliphila TaxID=2929485 RepID=A0AA41R0X6_9BACT|nr:preQ(1) synthase [Desulfatitalea alkaliphila]MCJ8499893.1 preQ(1) synthase [Desulfatitalea alkaliphila]
MADASRPPVPYDIKTSDGVRRELLSPIDYAYKDRREINITIRQPEFTSVCPMTGLPDYGTITIRYRPDRTIVELKSLKYYLLQYRNVGIFYEHVVNRILDDLAAVLAPQWMEVQGTFTARGGITTEVVAQYAGVSE